MKVQLMAATLCFFGGVISTQAQVGGVKVKVPFDFEVANKTLPAGEYVMWSQRDQVMLRAASGIMVAKVPANRTIHDGGASGKVIFNCYQRRCFLAQLWTADAEKAREIVKSKNEKEVCRRGEPSQFALLVEPMGKEL